MIVSEPPFELVALFADADAQKLVEALIERGQERSCLRSFRWRSIRDPRRDSLVHHPDRILSPLLGPTCRYLITWDHEGSGVETVSPGRVEQDVVAALVRRAIPEANVLAVALIPEVEQVLVPVFNQCLEQLAAKRGVAPPPRDRILARAGLPHLGFEAALAERPKEMLIAAIHLLNLRPSAALFQELGAKVSIPEIKEGVAARRIAGALLEWFPGRGRC